MYIKSIIIDGFKSYGKRTEIHGFDPEFNAITGLNGTGKSNILDSICFVLGISNLVHVRATSLQELVYKSGQAGVTKATVTLVFDNTDKEQCPLGYEKCNEISITRQIVVGGKNKYLINGKTVQNKKVQDLFCSVQLNVNNPNFLIMQGRITKVLNMKPQEILSMIEEAAGTSVYEAKREHSIKLIEKKDAKLNELYTVLREEIEPKLEKLRKERAHYIEYQKICRDIEYLTRLYISHKYLQHVKSVENSEKAIAALNDVIGGHRKKIEAHITESKEIEESAKALQELIDTEGGGVLAELESELSAESKKEATASAERDSTKENIAAEQRKLKNLQKSIKDDENALQKKEAEMQRTGDMFQSLKDADEADAKAFTDAQKRFEAVSAGLSTNEDGEAATLQDQLMAAKQKAAESATSIKQSEMELKHCQQLHKEKQGDMNSSDAAYLEDKKKLTKAESQIQAITAELQKIDYEEGSIEQLQKRKQELSQEIRNLKRELDNQNAARWAFPYHDPEPNFDRSTVHGRVAKLLSVKDKKYAVGLGIAAGGSLSSVVVDSDTTGKKLLQKGQLQSRTTFIPLNKITSHTIDNNTVRLADNLVGKGRAVTALSCIDYDRQLEPAMKFVFGRTFLAEDMNVAKQVTYHQDIRTRSVTLDGEVMNPDGTLSGGAKLKRDNVLLEVEMIHQIEELLTQKEAEFEQVGADISKLERVAHPYNQLKEQLDMMNYGLKTLQQRLAQTSYQQAQQEIEELKASIETLKKTMVDARQAQTQANAKVMDLTAKIADSKGHRERELKAAGDELKRTKQKSDESRKNWKKHEQSYEMLRLEIDALQKGIATAKELATKVNGTIAELQQKFLYENGNSAEMAKVVAAINKQLYEIDKNINMHKNELEALNQQRDKLLKQNQEIEFIIRNIESDIKKEIIMNNDRYKHIAKLEATYHWIIEDKQFFGVKNTRYDYKKEDPQNAARKINKLENSKEEMSRNINQKAIVLLEREEEDYKTVMDRKRRVEDDKKKLQKIIADLDKEKEKHLKVAWTEVNENFGSIIGTLLPGTQAQLTPCDGVDFLKGLEVKVSFNGMWKESLTELSGGQRSLVALSLILAMLKYKPAPLYILDEVDAALDLSHTQNIGNMLKAHFTNSQFIIVSLKDGMFNNANVLFRTNFTNGMSRVTRTVAHAKAKATEPI